VKRLHRILSTLSCIAVTASCTGTDTIFDPQKHDLNDQELSLSREDYYHITDPKAAAKTGEAASGAKPTDTLLEPPIPALATILAAPKPPKIGETQLVSIAVTDDVPLKDVFIELARLANIDIEVDSGITGGIDFRAKDRPFNEVVDRICSMANLRYTMKGSVLRVERDTPYVQVYSLDYLNLDRSAQSTANISTSVLSSGSGGGSGGGGLNNGSTSTVTSKADSDFWKQFEDSVKHILAYTEPVRTSDISIAQQPNLPQATAAPVASAAGAAAAPAAAPVAAVAAPPPAAGGNGAGGKAEGGFYIINRDEPAARVTVISFSSRNAVLPSVADIAVASTMPASRPIKSQSRKAVISI